MRILWSLLSVLLSLAFIGIVVRLIIGFGTLVLAGKLLWLALLLVVGAAALFLIRKAIRAV